MDRTGEPREALREASENIPPLRVEFAQQGTGPDGVTVGIYVIQVIAPVFTCDACGKKEPGQPTNLDRRIDADGPWARKAKYTFDFSAPIDWASDHEGVLCFDCNQGVERAKSFLFRKAREIWVEQRRKEIP